MRKTHVLIAMAITLLFGITLFSPVCIAADKPITLKVANFVPSGSFLGQEHTWWMKEIEKRTNGRIKIRMFWMQSLVKQTDMLPAVKAGIADIGWVPSTYFPSNLPLYMMLDNAGNCIPDYRATIMATIDTMDNEPNLKAELEREKLLVVGPYISGLGQLGMKTCMGSFTDVKKKTIRTYGSSGTNYFENLGANVLFMSYNDLYEAIDRGTIDGFQMAIALSDAFKHYEVVKCIYKIDVAAAQACGLTMNLDTFNKLPKDLQKIILDVRKEFALRYAKNLQDLEESVYKKWQTKHGVTIKELSSEEKRISENAIKDAREALIVEQIKKGHKGARAVWDYYEKTRDNYAKTKVYTK